MDFEAVTIYPFEEREKMDNDSDEFFVRAKGFHVIKNDLEYSTIARELKKVKAFLTETETQCRPRIKQVAKLKQDLLDDMNAILESAKTAEPVLKGLLVEYDNKQEQLRQERQAEIERERIKEEADSRAREEKRKLETAEELEKAGRHEEADAVLNQPDRTPSAPSNVATAPMKAKVAGLHYRETWKAECTETNLDHVDERFIKKVFDQEMANAYAKSNKEGAKAKGIRFYAEKIAVNRA